MITLCRLGKCGNSHNQTQVATQLYQFDHLCKMLVRSRTTHFSRASKDFAKRIEKDPSIKEKLNLTDKEIEQFKDGDVPVRFTWHHQYNAEQSAMSSMGNGSKLLSGFAGSSGSQSGQAGNAGTAGDGKGQEKKGGQEGGKSQGGGDFLSLLKSGVHTRLMTFGLMNIRKLGAKVIAAGAAKVTGVIKKMLTPKVKFKLGAEEHELWVEKGKNRNVVMMASKNPAPIKVKIQEGEMKNNGEENNKCKGIESEKDDQKVDSKTKYWPIPYRLLLRE